MKRIKKLTALLLVICFIVGFAAPAFARECYWCKKCHRYHPYGYHHRHRDHDHTGEIVAGVVGVVALAALASSAEKSEAKPAATSEQPSQKAAPKQAEFSAEQYKSQAKEIAQREYSFLNDSVSRYGDAKALSYIDDKWHSKGFATLYKAGNPSSTLKIADVDRHFAITYSVNTAKHYISVNVQQPANKISETIDGNYTDLHPVDNIAGYAGFMIGEDSRTSDKYMKVVRVEKATAAEHAGIKAGTVLYKVDDIDTSKASCDEVRKYIATRASTHAIVTLAIGNNGAKKAVQIRL